MTAQTFRQSWTALLGLFARFTPFVLEDKFYLGINVAFIVAIAVTNTVILWLLSKPLNLLQQGDFDAIGPALLLLGGVIVINQLTHFGANTLTAWLELRAMTRARSHLLKCAMDGSFGTTDRFAPGDLLSRLSGETERVTHFSLYAAFALISHFCIFSFYSVMLFWIDPWLALLAALGAPVFILHQRFFGRRKQRAATAYFKHNGRLVAYEAQALQNLRGISSLRVEKHVLQSHHAVLERTRHFAMRGKWLDAWIHGTLMALIYLGALAIVFVGIIQIRAGEMLVGDLVSFLFFLGYLSVPIQGTAQLALQGREMSAATERLTDVMEIQPPVKEAADAADLRVTEGKIEFRDVTFAYPGGRRVLERISLIIEPGQTVALVGPSGAGKSTLARLLMRFYDPCEGSVRIDGTDIRRVSLDSLRREIAVVWQEPFLMNDTVEANLRLARPRASPAELEAACRAARAWDFIEQLPQGLGTLLGTGGVDLSAGQRQRLSLAQAFLRDARLLILDEASSALDSETERLIAEALNSLRAGKTTLIIAHRFSAIRSADRVVFFNGDGSLTSGSHDELWERHTAYRDAVQWQTRSWHAPEP